MTLIETIGWLAAGATIATFSMNQKIMLRGVAIISNLLFIAYGLMGGLFPILALHLILLPINIVKFYKMKNRQFKIKKKKKPATDVTGI